MSETWRSISHKRPHQIQEASIFIFRPALWILFDLECRERNEHRKKEVMKEV